MEEKNTQNTQPENVTAQQPQKKSKKGLVIGIIAAVVVVAITVAAFMLTVGGKASAESVENCRTQLTALKVHQDALKTTQEEAATASKLKGVKDASLLDDLKSAQADVDKLGDAPTCPANGSQKDVDAAIDAIRQYSDDLRSATSGLDAAAKAVIASTSAEE
ncbi:hypothetical protein [Bifidobacterium platyrrhinorum]|uniref:Colicin transporter n=1 Tax=Bifidobacterium platyrrhinorum TaxID=2661628 RepID=A0A6L9SQM9_9BIFI|nr:hypothetical protein [Bifidobacterium platyrrhinorum]NEG54867.1 hypothetical protein [Bifidobacterium platyrrhinorum]